MSETILILAAGGIRVMGVFGSVWGAVRANFLWGQLTPPPEHCLEIAEIVA